MYAYTPVTGETVLVLNRRKGERLICRLRTTGLETNMRHYEQQKGSRTQKLEKVARFIVGHLS